MNAAPHRIAVEPRLLFQLHAVDGPAMLRSILLTAAAAAGSVVDIAFCTKRSSFGEKIEKHSPKFWVEPNPK